ncbi:MAG: hypothetical protein R6U98_30895 [Pirellulaceae bacterium]
MESCPTQAVLPLVGLAAAKVIRDRYKGSLKNNFAIPRAFESSGTLAPLAIPVFWRGNASCRSVPASEKGRSYS